MKLGRDEVLMARTCVYVFYQICPGVDRHGKKESKRESKTKGFTWNAAILVVILIFQGVDPGRDKNR